MLRLGETTRIHPLVRPFTLSHRWSGQLDEYVQLFTTCQVLGATVYTNISHFPRNIIFDICIIDEAGQITEPAILQVLLLARKALLVGDSKQLPPLVRNEVAVNEGLNISLLARLEKQASLLFSSSSSSSFQVSMVNYVDLG